MRHAAHAPVSAPVTRHARRWRRMRARLGFAALWAALLVWVLGASVRVPGEAPTAPEVDRHAVAPADVAQVVLQPLRGPSPTGIEQLLQHFSLGYRFAVRTEG